MLTVECEALFTFVISFQIYLAFGAHRFNHRIFLRPFVGSSFEQFSHIFFPETSLCATRHINSRSLKKKRKWKLHDIIIPHTNIPRTLYGDIVLPRFHCSCLPLQNLSQQNLLGILRMTAQFSIVTTNGVLAVRQASLYLPAWPPGRHFWKSVMSR